jgi:type VI secretion system protein ImpJ
VANIRPDPRLTGIDSDRIWAQNDADRWVLALWAPYVEASFPTVASDPIWFEKLDGRYPPDMAEGCRQTLADDWGIVNLDSMITRVRALLDVGHREEYNEARAFLVENGLLRKSEAALEAVARFRVECQSEIVDPAQRTKAIRHLTSIYRFVSDSEPGLGEAGIAGWDYMRVGNITSLALVGDLVEPADCWPLLYEAAEAAQTRFRSWRHVAESFDRGRQWWGQGTRASENRFATAVNRLLEHPDSPWRRLDWHTDLDPSRYPDLETQAEAGSAQAQYLLAIRLRHGHGGTIDERAAFSWMVKAANSGHPLARGDLGIMYRSSAGAVSDVDGARHRASADEIAGNADTDNEHATTTTGQPVLSAASELTDDPVTSGLRSAQSNDTPIAKSVAGGCDWGLTNLSIDEDALRAGVFAIVQCSGKLPDRSIFEIPASTPAPQPLPIPVGSKDRFVRLSFSSRRYEPSLYLDAGCTSTSTLLKIAMVVDCTTAHGISLSSDFVPPCLHVNVSSTLAGHLSECCEIVHRQAERLAQRFDAERSGDTDRLRSFMLLQVLNRIEPLLYHFRESAALHPLTLYRALISAIGELSTFANDRCRPGGLPAYDHDDLAATFDVLFREFRGCPVFQRPTPAIPLQLKELKYGIRVARVDDYLLATKRRYILTVKAGIPIDYLVTRLQSVVTVAPAQDIVRIVNSRSHGISFTLLPATPPQIPYENGILCFELAMNSDHWSRLKTSRALAIHIAENIPELQVELWCIAKVDR